MEKPKAKKIAINAISASIQVLFVGLSYFFLYKYLIKQIGIAQLGVWSLILSTSSIATLANFGITSGLVKFVADYRAKNKAEQIAGLIFTAFISVAAFYGILGIIIYLLASIILGHIVDKEHIEIALRLLPFSLLSLFINEIGGVFTSVIEGYQKNYIRNIIYICSTVVFLVLVVIIVPHYHLIGVAYAQIAQAIFVMLAALYFASKVSGGVNMNSLRWKKASFHELIAYGSKFQVISIFQMSYEPITKALLSKIGGLAMVGFYEMASRLVNQVRALVVNANQVMIPVVAEAVHKGDEQVKNLYQKSLSVTLLLSSILVGATISAGGLVSVLWIGHYEPIFVFALNVLAGATFINIICGPGYFGALGEGKLNLLLITHFTMAILNLMICYLLGTIFHGYGVIAGWAITLGSGSFLIMFLYQKTLRIKSVKTFTRDDLILFFGTIMFIIISFIVSNWNKHVDGSILVLVSRSIIPYLFIILPLAVSNKNLNILIRKIIQKSH